MSFHCCDCKSEIQPANLDERFSKISTSRTHDDWTSRANSLEHMTALMKHINLWHDHYWICQLDVPLTFVLSFGSRQVFKPRSDSFHIHFKVMCAHTPRNRERMWQTVGSNLGAEFASDYFDWSVQLEYALRLLFVDFLYRFIKNTILALW